MTTTVVIDQPIDPLALHRLHPERYPYLLESVVQNPRTARWSIVFAFPADTLQLTSLGAQGDFLDRLDGLWQAEHGPPPACRQLPFHGGWFVYLGYELAGQVEPTLVLPPAETGLPVAFATRVPAAVIVDHFGARTWLVAESEHGHLLEAMHADVTQATARAMPEPAAPCEGGAVVEDDPEPYLEAVARVKRYIVDGDVFQVNLSRAWRGHLRRDADPADLYQLLRRSNPAPFAGFARFGDRAVVSSSPERLVRVRDGHVDTRPIAGTRRRGTGSEDEALSRELMAHPKERAEHVMLIDLERNDLGRVCRPGTVHVDELMVLESYAHVHHIVSNVTGVLAEGMTPGRVIRAVFPGGTITGCPKVRCMEILAELEGVGRGPYTGSMGYLNRDGSMDLNILIRTVAVCGRRLVLRAGGGIVADSVPERELEETRAKARGLLLALTSGEALAP